MSPRIKIVTSIAHHRNGSAGVPFYVVLFNIEEWERSRE